MASSNNKQIALNLVFNTISFAINFAISFLFTPYLIRTVGKEAYSFFPLVNNIIGYSSILTTAVGSMAGRFVTMRIYQNDIDGANKYFNSVWVANIILSILFTIVACVCIVFLPSILTIPEYLVSEVKWLFLFGFISLVIGLITGILGLGTFVKNRLDLQASRQVVTNVIRVCSICLLFYLFKPSIVYMSLSVLIAGVVGVYFNVSFKKKLLPELTIKPSVFFSTAALKEVTLSGVWNSVNQLSNVLLQQLDLLIANVFISAAATGDLSIAKTAPMLILNLLAMLSGSFLPHFNILYAKGEQKSLISEIKKSMVIVSFFIGIPLGFLVVFSGDFFRLWVPSEDSSTLYYLSMLSVLPMIIGGSVNPIFGVFTITNKLKIPSLVLLISGVVNTACIYLLLKMTDLGVWSIPLVSAIQMTLRNFFFTTIYGAVCLNQKWYAFYPSILKGILGMAVVVCCGLLFRHFISVDNWITFFAVLAGVSVLSMFSNGFVMLNSADRKYIVSKVMARLRR